MSMIVLELEGFTLVMIADESILLLSLNHFYSFIFLFTYSRCNDNKNQETCLLDHYSRQSLNEPEFLFLVTNLNIRYHLVPNIAVLRQYSHSLHQCIVLHLEVNELLGRV